MAQKKTTLFYEAKGENFQLIEAWVQDSNGNIQAFKPIFPEFLGGYNAMEIMGGTNTARCSIRDGASTEARSSQEKDNTPSVS